MIRMHIVKWMAASAIAIAAVPAISMARHTSHVSAAPLLSAETSTTSLNSETKSKPAKSIVSKSKKKTRHHTRAKAHAKSHKATKATKAHKSTKSKSKHRAKKHAK